MYPLSPPVFRPNLVAHRPAHIIRMADVSHSQICPNMDNLYNFMDRNTPQSGVNPPSPMLFFEFSTAAALAVFVVFVSLPTNLLVAVARSSSPNISDARSSSPNISDISCWIPLSSSAASLHVDFTLATLTTRKS